MQRVGLQYTLENRQNFLGIPPLTKDRVHAALKAAVDKGATSTNKKIKSKPGADLRKSLAVAITEVPPILVDHVLQTNNFDTTTKPAEILETDSLLDALVQHLIEARGIVESITSKDTCTGYIMAKKQEKSSDSAGSNEKEGLLYDDFHPFLPQKFKNDATIKVLQFEGFNRTVDEFFSSLEGQRLESRLNEREAAAKRKLDAAKQDQAKRLEGLKEAQTLNFRKAAAIEANVERVQEAMDAVNGLLAQGMDWVDIGKLVEREKKKQNPVADIIVLPLKLEENIITLRLAEEEDENQGEAEEEDPFETDSESENEGGTDEAKPAPTYSALNVDIVLTASPWSNAREYYDERKNAVVKEEKTQQQAEKALKSTEQKIQADLKKGLRQEKALLQPVRNQMWFEKFFWFISSDGYLVLAGKDQSQDELLYRRHLRKGDVFCHSDVKDASVVVIKNNLKTADAPIPPATLSQAGNFSICTSEAWDSKAGMGAWWVNAEQVSKINSHGDVLLPGTFNISGEKNHLPPGQLLLGLGLLFKISDESKARHPKHRLDNQDDDESASKTVQEVARKDGHNPKSSHSDAESEADEPEDGSDAEMDEDKRANPLQGLNSAGNGNESDKSTQEIEDKLPELSVSKESEPNEQDDDSDEEQDDAADTQSIAANSEVPSATGTGTNKKPAKRGQKGKAKKIANKYKDQDDEDRAAAEALIGATVGARKAEAEAQARAEREAEQEAAKQRRRAQHIKKQKETVQHEERRRALLMDGGAGAEEDDEDLNVALDTLVGTPRPGDEILEVVAICAPITALGKVKYKVKMQPGPMKKGKAVKEIIERWKIDTNKKGVVDETSRDSERMWPREVELIKTLKAEEMVNTVPTGKVRLMISGGSGGGKGGSGKGSGGKGGKGGGRGKK